MIEPTEFRTTDYKKFRIDCGNMEDRKFLYDLHKEGWSLITDEESNRWNVDCSMSSRPMSGGIYIMTMERAKQ